MNSIKYEHSCKILDVNYCFNHRVDVLNGSALFVKLEINIQGQKGQYYLGIRIVTHEAYHGISILRNAIREN